MSRTSLSFRYVCFPELLPPPIQSSGWCVVQARLFPRRSRNLGTSADHRVCLLRSATSTTPSPTISSPPPPSSLLPSRLPGGSTTSPPPSVSSRVRLPQPPASIEASQTPHNILHLGYTRPASFGANKRKTVADYRINRHQGQGREQGPVRAVPRGAQAPAGGARRASQGGHVPRGEISGFKGLKRR